MGARYEKQKGQHNREALPLARRLWEARGFRCHQCGVDDLKDGIELARDLAAQWDYTSYLVRYFADLCAVRKGDRSALLEIKSESGAYDNFVVEGDALRGAHLWAAAGATFVYCFLDLLRPDDMRCCRAEAIIPGRFFIPTRGDHIETAARLKRHFPKATQRFVEPTEKGSNAAYLKVPKDWPGLVTFEVFLDQERLR